MMERDFSVCTLEVIYKVGQFRVEYVDYRAPHALQFTSFRLQI